MELAQALFQLWSRKIWLAIGLVAAALAGLASVALFKSTVYAAATTQMIVDSPRSALGDISSSLDPFTARAGVFARLMTSPQALEAIGNASGIPGNAIAATGPADPTLPQVSQTPTQSTTTATQFKLELNQDPTLPTVDISAEAPTQKQAIAIANGAVTGFARYLDSLEAQGGIPPAHRVEVRQLGTALGGTVDPSASKKISALIAVVVFLLWCAGILMASKMRAGWAVARAARAEAAAPPAPNGAVAPQLARFRRSGTVDAPRRAEFAGESGVNAKGVASADSVAALAKPASARDAS